MLTQFYPPIIGGEETHVQTLSRELAARGHQVAVATIWHSGTERNEVVDGVQIYRLEGLLQKANWLYKEPSRHHAAPIPDPVLMQELKKVIQAWQPQIVHAHNWMLHSFTPLKQWSGAAFVVTLHDYSFACATKRLMYQGQPCSGPGMLKCLRCSAEHYGVIKGSLTAVMNAAMHPVETHTVDEFISVSRAVSQGNELNDYHVDQVIIPNFISDDLPRAAAENYQDLLDQLPQGDFLLYVGDVSRQKGIGVLLHAYERLKHSLAEATPPLVLIGRHAGDLPAEFPTGVIYLGSWPHDAVLQAWRHCAVAVAPSIWPEPFGIVVLEAMSAGKPVVASCTGGLIDIVEDMKSGFLVTPGDDEALAKAILALISDPERRTAMGEQARLRVRQFQASQVIPQIEAVYESLIPQGSQQ